MIEIAVGLSAAVDHWVNFVIILILVVSNATVGFWEDRQAGNVIQALSVNLAVSAQVRLDGTWTTPPARHLVPGDVIRLRIGDIGPNRRVAAGRRRDRARPIRPDRRVAAGSRSSGDAAVSDSIIRRDEIDVLVYATR